MPFQHTYEIRYFDSGRTGRVTPVALYSYLQETALRHCDHAGLTTPRLFEMGYTWMLNRVHMRVERYPAYKESVRVETWPVNISGMYSMREFLVHDPSNALFARATTRWVLIDLEKRRPVRPPEHMAQGFELCGHRAIDDAFPKLDPVTRPAAAKMFHVRLSDLDINGHANSASYFDWVLETAPEPVLQTMVPASVEIFYRVEAGPGAAIESRGQEISAGAPQRAFLHELRAVADDTLLAQARSVWRPE